MRATLDEENDGKKKDSNSNFTRIKLYFHDKKFHTRKKKSFNTVLLVNMSFQGVNISQKMKDFLNKAQHSPH